MPMPMSFSRRIAIYFGALFVVAIGILYALWFFGLPAAGLLGESEQRVAQAMRALEVKADLQRRLIDQGIFERRGDMLVVAENVTLMKALATAPAQAQPNVERVFERLQRAYPDRYQRLLIVDPVTQRVIASSVPVERGTVFADTQLLNRATQPGATELIDSVATFKTTPALTIVRQIHAPDRSGYPKARLVGILVAFIEVSAFVGQLERDGLMDGGSQGYTVLLDAQRQLLARFPVDIQSQFELNHGVAPGFEGTVVHADEQGRENLVVYRHVQLGGALGWTLVQYASMDDALRGLRKSANALVAAGAGLSIAALFLIGLAARRVTRPLHALASTAQQLGAGDLSVRFEPRLRESREMVALAEAFNTMAGEVQKSHQLLEMRVQERTAALARSEARHRSLFESSADAILVLEPSGVVDCNPCAVAMFGLLNRADLIGLHPADLSPAKQPDGADSLVSANLRMQRAMQAGSLVFEWLHHRVDTGATFLAEVLLSPVEVEGRTLLQGIVRDISERKQAQEALRLSEQNLSITLQSIGDAVIATDAQGRITRMNSTAERLTGWRLSEASGRALSEVFNIISSQTRMPATDPVQLVMERGEVVGLSNHTALLSRAGAQYQIADSAAPIRNAQGQTVGVVLVFSDVTEDYRLREALEKTALLLARTGEIAKVGGWELDLGTMAMYFSPESLRINDLDPGASVTLEQVINMIDPAARPATQAAVEAAISVGEPWDLEVPITTARGRHIWARSQGNAIMEEGKAVKLLGALHDITEQKNAELELRIAAIAFESQEGMFVADAQWRILRVNRAFSEITGYSSRESVGQMPNPLLGSGHQGEAFFEQMTLSIQTDGTWRGEVWDRRKNSEVFPAWLTITAVKDKDRVLTHYVATLTDITQRKAAEEQIRNLAFFDPLTQLPNRRLLLDRLGKALTSSLRHQRKGALLFVDLDNFKGLNDTLGHDRGDLLLQQVSKRLSTCIREGDTVARLGGDEFVVMLEDLSADIMDAAQQAEMVGEKILSVLNATYFLGPNEHHSTPSIGVTLFGDDYESIDEPLKRADLAMYQAKGAGRNTLRFFDPQMQAVVTARVNLESSLRDALAQQQFTLNYQLQVAATANDGDRVTGCEALVRWRHPQRGMVSPAEFIPIAEETGLILPLGQWVLETACRQLTTWSLCPALAHLTVAVNVSARQFRQPQFVEQVLRVLELTGANPARLKLELTESMLVTNIEDVVTKVEALRAVGVGFSLDDFGTGYSSLSYLKRLPLDQLKIDQGFVRDILVDPNDAAISKMVVALAHSLGLSVIAEGVETQAQRDFLASQGCHTYQGYLFARPLPVLEMEALVASMAQRQAPL
jgi:diguanylate cyclase (GGDEF)-like protein/PAS domain S-box-containing protein